MKKEGKAEFQYVKIPYGEDVFAKLGSEWICMYGVTENGVQMEKNHFHNLMEIGVCRWGTGEVILDKKKCPYKTGDILIVPQNFPHRIASQAKEGSFWEFMYLKPSLFLERIYRTESRKREIMMQEVECHSFLIARENAKVFASELDRKLSEINFSTAIMG